MKTLKEFLDEANAGKEAVMEGEEHDIELKPHENGTHYIVHKISKKSGIGSDQLKVGEKISDTHVDDLNDSGYSVHIHEAVEEKKLTESSEAWKADVTRTISRIHDNDRHGHHDGGTEWTSHDDHKTTVKKFRDHLKDTGHINIRKERGDGSEHYSIIHATAYDHKYHQEDAKHIHQIETKKNADGSYHHELYTQLKGNQH